MAESSERAFKIAATLETIEKGQDLNDFPHLTILRWLHEDMPWGEFETRLQALFGRPNPFDHPDSPSGPRVVRSNPSDSDEVMVTKLSGVSKWPYLGVGALIRSLDGKIVNEDFASVLPGVDPNALGVGTRVRFASIAAAEHKGGEQVQQVVFAHPVINAPKPRG